jgi:hypothetical protein
MMALRKKMLEQAPGEIELLLPWHAAGTLNPRDMRRVEDALARDPELARQYDVIRDEYAETIALNESLGAPSGRGMQKLFSAIDAEPARERPASPNLSSRISSFFASLSPRTLAWSASVAALALIVQAGVIGTVLLRNPATYQTASLSLDEPITRTLSREGTPPRALVRFAPDARMSDITALLDQYQASIVGGASGGLLRLQFGDKTMSHEEVGTLMHKLQGEKIVNMAVATP